MKVSKGFTTRENKGTTWHKETRALLGIKKASGGKRAKLAVTREFPHESYDSKGFPLKYRSFCALFYIKHHLFFATKLDLHGSVKHLSSRLSIILNHP